MNQNALKYTPEGAHLVANPFCVGKRDTTWLSFVQLRRSREFLSRILCFDL